ncbi:MAG: flavin monoamine oxidase family protein [Actinomycetales bacterium]
MTTEATMRMVEPLPAATGSASVIVIGAGMAGLATALELKEAGYQVHVVEARHRAGGRVRTQRDFPDGLYVEQGATRFPDVHHYTMHYLHRFGLPLIRFDRPDLGDTLRIMGRNVVHHPWQRDAWPAELGLLPDERRLSWEGLLQRYLAPLLAEVGDPLHPNWPSAALVDAYGHLGFGDLLRSRGASAGAVRALTLGFHVGEGVNSVSALWFLQALALDAGSQCAFKVEGGNDLLAEAFAARLTEELHFGRVATGIEVDQDAVTVHTNGPAGTQAHRADYAVCTLPLPVLARMPIRPGLPQSQADAIATVPYASLSRVALQCRTRFWLEQGRSGFVHTDDFIPEIWDLTVDEPGARGILVGYCGGEQARAVAAKSEADRVTDTITRLGSIFPGLAEQVEGGSSICWDDDPLALGGGAWFRPGDLALRPLLAVPHGRLHFAGEGSSNWPGWVQGAFESARRAAAAILRATGGIG